MYIHILFEHTDLTFVLICLSEKLKEKKFTIISSFSCPGFNTNLFLKYFGGTNKNRPNEEDLKNAKKFALKIKDSF